MHAQFHKKVEFHHIFCLFFVCSYNDSFLFPKPVIISCSSLQICEYYVVFQSFFGFGQNADIDIILDGAESRRMAEIRGEDGRKLRHYLYYDGETVSGKVNLFSLLCYHISDIFKVARELSNRCFFFIGEYYTEEARSQVGAPGHEDRIYWPD